ncbi:FAD-dependent monooxygenase [Streptomyces sp. NPDC051569]|uniref:FAD-dependent monooxygenase n=1 Tax=Streptomyces sp. NPDC051569 TaxID=3365661 RepID=UPI0037B16926
MPNEPSRSRTGRPRAGRSTDVLVVGAGPTGLTLACDLARRGLVPLVVERAGRLFPGSRGKGLQPRTQEVFEDLGVIDAVRAAGAPFPPMQTWRDGRRLGRWPLIEEDPGAPASRYALPWMLPQWRTQRILYDRLRALGGRVEFGTRLVSLTRTADHVEAGLTADDGRTRTVTAAYLVGADGGRSTTREVLGIRMTGAPQPLRSALVADVRLTGLDRDGWHIWPEAPGGTMALCPLPGTDDFQLSVHTDDAFPDGRRPEPTLDWVRRTVAARSHLAADAITEVLWASHYQPRTALAERFRDGRVFLAGDSAHVHPPGGGQGLNIGVQDAYNLGWKLGQVLRHGAPPALLDSYEAERRPVAVAVLELSTQLYRAGRDPDGGSADARRRGRVTHQLSYTYRESPVTDETRPRLPEESVQAGDRVPDMLWPTADGAPRRLYDLLAGPDLAVLAVDCDPPRVPAGVRVHRAEGPLAGKELGTGLFVVRPDGYIGMATRDPERVPRYLAGLGAG